MSTDAIRRHVEAMTALRSESEKKRYLQQLIGPPTDDKHTLHFRALLMTALDRAEVWPHRSARREAA